MDSNNRNTRQKQIILDVLRTNKIHPTIKEIYYLVSKIDPSIGQATVYRNVNRLVDEKKIVKIPTFLGVDHYDIDCNPHYHLYCTNCHKLFDIFDSEYYSLVDRVEKEYLVKINSGNIVFEGICNRCL